jgi:hypothetical protein
MLQERLLFHFSKFRDNMGKGVFWAVCCPEKLSTTRILFIMKERKITVLRLKFEQI